MSSFKEQVVRLTKMLEKTYAEIEESRRQAKDNEVECNQLRADMEKSKAENIRLRDRIKDFKRIGVPSFASQNTQEAYQLKGEYDNIVSLSKLKNYMDKMVDVFTKLQNFNRKLWKNESDEAERQNQLQQIERMFGKASSGIVRYQEELFRNSVSKEMLRNDNAKLQKENDLLLQFTTQVQINFKETDKQVKKYTNQFAKLQEETEQLRMNNEMLEKENEKLKTDNQKMQKDIERFQFGNELVSKVAIHSRQTDLDNLPYSSHFAETKSEISIVNLMDKIAKLEAENKQIRSITLEKISEISEGRQVGKLKKYPSKSPAACEGSSPRFNDRNIEEIERLKEKLFQAEQMCSKQQLELNKLTTQYKSLKDEKQVHKQRIESLKVENGLFLSKQEQLQIMILEKEAQVKALNDKLQHSEQEKDKIVLVYQNEAKEISSKLLKKKDIISELQTIVNSEQVKIQQLKKQIAQKRKSIVQLEQQVNSQRDEKEALKQSVKEKQIIIKRVQTELAHKTGLIQSNVEVSLEQQKLLKQTIEQLRRQNRKTTEQMTKLKDECSRSKNDYNKINIEWKNFSQDLKEIKMSLAKMANNKELDCMGLIELVAKRIKDLTDEIANLQAYNNQLYNSKQQLEKEHKIKLKQQIEALEQEVTAADERQRGSYEQQLQKSREQVRTLKAVQRQLEEELANFKRKHKQLQSQLILAQKEVFDDKCVAQELKASVMLSQLKATNSYARTEEIEKELLEQKDMIIEKERIIVGLLEEKSQLKQKLDDETEKVSLLQLEIETLNKQIQKWKIQAISQEQKLQKLQCELQCKDRLINEQKELSEQRDNMCEQNQEQLELLAEEIKKMTTKTDSQQKRIVYLEDQKIKLIKQMELCTMFSKETATELANTKAILEEMQEQLKKTEAKCAQYKHQIITLAEQKKSMEKQFADYEQKMQAQFQAAVEQYQKAAEQQQSNTQNRVKSNKLQHEQDNGENEGKEDTEQKEDSEQDSGNEESQVQEENEENEDAEDGSEEQNELDLEQESNDTKSQIKIFNNRIAEKDNRIVELQTVMEKAQKKIISNEDAFKQIEAERQKLAKEHQEQEIRWEIDLKYFEEQLSQAKTMVNRLKGQKEQLEALNSSMKKQNEEIINELRERQRRINEMSYSLSLTQNRNEILIQQQTDSQSESSSQLHKHILKSRGNQIPTFPGIEGQMADTSKSGQESFQQSTSNNKRLNLREMESQTDSQLMPQSSGLMTQHMEELEKQFSTLRGELEQLKDGDIKIKELKEENKRKDQEIECLTEELQLAKEAEKEAKEVTSKVAEVKKYISELQEQVRNMTAETSFYKQKIAQSEQQIKQFKEALEETFQEAANANKIIQTLSAELASLRQQFAAAQKQVIDLELELSTARQRQQQYQKESSKQSSQKSEISEQFSQQNLMISSNLSDIPLLSQTDFGLKIQQPSITYNQITDKEVPMKMFKKKAHPQQTIDLKLQNEESEAVSQQQTKGDRALLAKLLHESSDSIISNSDYFQANQCQTINKHDLEQYIGNSKIDMKEQDESYYQALLEAEMKKCAELARQLAEEAQMNRQREAAISLLKMDNNNQMLELQEIKREQQQKQSRMEELRIDNEKLQNAINTLQMTKDQLKENLEAKQREYAETIAEYGKQSLNIQLSVLDGNRSRNLSTFHQLDSLRYSIVNDNDQLQPQSSGFNMDLGQPMKRAVIDSINEQSQLLESKVSKNSEEGQKLSATQEQQSQRNSINKGSEYNDSMLLFDREKYLEGDRYETEKESWLRQRNLKDKLRAIEKEKDDLMRQNQKMGSEIARMINQINRMNSDLNMKDRTIATLQQSIRNKTEEIVKLQRRLQTKEDELNFQKRRSMQLDEFEDGENMITNSITIPRTMPPIISSQMTTISPTPISPRLQFSHMIEPPQ